MSNRASYLLWTALLVLLFVRCSPSRHLATGERVLYDNTINVVNADSSTLIPEVASLTPKASPYILQSPNTRFLGIKRLRIPLFFYNLSSPTDSTFINNYLRRIGEPPVVYDVARARRSAMQLQAFYASKGCFNATATFDTTAISDHEISIAYHVKVSPRYRIAEVVYHAQTDAVTALLSRWRNDMPLKEDTYYDQDNLIDTRNLIVERLRNEGYYAAQHEGIRFVVDTTYSSSHLSVDVYVADSNWRIYHLNNIFIYPNSTADLLQGRTVADTQIYTYPMRSRTIDFLFVHDKPMSIRPQTISRAMLLFPGMTYRPRFVSNTYNSLLNLHNFRYINIDFSPSPTSTDSLPLLDAHVRLINANQQKISLSLELTNASPLTATDSGNFWTNGNLGIETSLEYRHKNIFGGAEQLKVKGSVLMELPKLLFRRAQNTDEANFSALEASLETTLDMPIFLLPLAKSIVWQSVRPHTLVSLNGSYQYHPYFQRLQEGVSFGYSWSSKLTHNHQWLPIEFSYVRVYDIDDAFAQRLRRASDLRLAYQYSSHFIMDARYDYTFTNQQIGVRHNFTSLHLSVETAGNLLSGISSLVSGNKDENGVRQLFNVPYAQYVRLGADASRHIYHGNRSDFVARAIIGIGMPYSNSVAMPYEKSFYGGGPTTMRAWQLRHLGPGSYQGSATSIERVGDLQIVLNLEERFPIAGVFEGALFTDMGNVWLFNHSDQYEGGEFTLARAWKEIAVGVGMGLRVNISVATIRLDLGIPLIDPGFDDANRFRPPHWKMNQIVTNIGIGYPF
ncbi:MAG: BamA/TamA family outer membrane protein [Bacteroidales bacterium]|nr:BamA/TamA family outer membrane protein [Bacteroidales bacterium]